MTDDLILLAAAVANTDDMRRLYMLELAGELPPGFTDMATAGVMRYLWRVVELRYRFRRHWWQMWRPVYLGPAVLCSLDV